MAYPPAASATVTTISRAAGHCGYCSFQPASRGHVLIDPATAMGTTDLRQMTPKLKTFSADRRDRQSAICFIELFTSGGLEDSREAEKGVSHTRSLATLDHRERFVKVRARPRPSVGSPAGERCYPGPRPWASSFDNARSFALG
jgi:hypothetical protein